MSEPKRATASAGTRSRKGAETRARLIEAAKSVFEEDGFLDARISDISNGAGVSHGAFYHYFDSKEQVFREIAEQQERLLTKPLNPESPEFLRGEAVSHRERIRRANRRYLEQYRDEARIMGEIEQLSRYDEQVRAARTSTQKHFAERVELSIRQLQKAGAADQSLDPAVTAMALGAMVARFAELWLVQGNSDYDFEDVVEQLTALWCNALRLDESQ